jgi:hypothetical protein
MVRFPTLRTQGDAHEKKQANASQDDCGRPAKRHGSSDVQGSRDALGQSVP